MVGRHVRSFSLWSATGLWLVRIRLVGQESLAHGLMVRDDGRRSKSDEHALQVQQTLDHEWRDAERWYRQASKHGSGAGAKELAIVRQRLTIGAADTS